MKKLAAFLIILSFGLFTIGCGTEPAKKPDPKKPDAKADDKKADDKAKEGDAK